MNIARYSQPAENRMLIRQPHYCIITYQARAILLLSHLKKDETCIGNCCRTEVGVCGHRPPARYLAMDERARPRSRARRVTSRTKSGSGRGFRQIAPGRSIADGSIRSPPRQDISAVDSTSETYTISEIREPSIVPSTSRANREHEELRRRRSTKTAPALQRSLFKAWPQYRVVEITLCGTRDR